MHECLKMLKSYVEALIILGRERYPHYFDQISRQVVDIVSLEKANLLHQLI